MLSSFALGADSPTLSAVMCSDTLVLLVAVGGDTTVGGNILALKMVTQ